MGQVAPERLGRLPADRNDALLAALADRAHEPLVEVDPALLEPDGLADAQPGAVEELDQRVVAQRARRRSLGRLDQPLGLVRRERPRQAARAARQVELRGRVVGPRAEQRLVAEERANRGRSPRDRRGGAALRSELRQVPLEIRRRRGRDRLSEPARDGGQVAPVRVDGARREPGG